FRRLLVYLSEADPMPHYADWAVLFGSDLEHIAWAAMSHSHFNRLLISGGPGRYMPASWKTEADGFMQMLKGWGRDWAKPRIDITLERESRSTVEHAQVTARII